MTIDISLDDLIIAYRKAKVEVFYEGSDPVLLQFIDFESNLIDNLSKLLTEIKTGKISLFDNKVRPFHLLIKSLEVNSQREPFVYHSDGKRAWNGNYGKSIDFRVVGALPVKFHILSSLWIDKVGHKFEAKLSENVHGGRLKRNNQSKYYVDVNSNDYSPKANETTHFRSYIWDYKKWQQKGVATIQESLEKNKPVIAITTDLKKFYNNIDPSFIVNENYWDALGLVKFTQTEIYINKLFYNVLENWSSITHDSIPGNLKVHYNGHLGIPIGLAASKLIANILLIPMDTEIERELLPLYYGRYIDDIFLVLPDNKRINSRESFWEFVSKRIPAFENIDSKNKSSDIIYNHAFSERSHIIFGKEKEKLFVLEGSSGQTFINDIKETLDENSSEWRLLPDSQDDFEDAAKQIVNSSSDATEIVNSIRQSDGVSIQRLKFALFLRNTEEMVLNLPKAIWNDSVDSFIKLCKDFVFTPENIGTYTKYHSRIFRLMVHTGKDKAVKELLAIIRETIEILIAESEFKQDEESLLAFRKYEEQVIEQAIYTSVKLADLTNEKLIIWKNIFKSNFNSEFDIKRSVGAFVCDLHLAPLKSLFFDKIDIYSDLLNPTSRITKRANSFTYLKKFFINIDNIELNKKVKPLFNEYDSFKKVWNKYYKPGKIDGVPIGLMLYTRKLSLLEITQLIKGWLTNEKQEFEVVTKLFDYPKIKPEFIESSTKDNDYWQVNINKTIVKNPVFALTSYEVKPESWDALVRSKKEPDGTRIQRLFDLVNKIIECEKQVDYIVLPELSVPRNVLNLLCKHLKTKNISLITGVEYYFYEKPTIKKKFATNQLAYVLCVDIGGIKHQVQIIQDKTIPAYHEGQDLYDKSGIMYRYKNPDKYIINHKGFFFSGLICNDLLNIDNRQKLRGKVDALIIVEWNPDIDMYNALVEATANDLHSFVVQVNNRVYGDTRLRAPYRVDYERDIARIKGGELDFFVVSTLDTIKIRDFQKHHISPPKPFKPVPTGFKISEERRKIDNK